MGWNETPSGERIHIGFFGRVNAGKSSLLNAVCGQQLAVVSEQKGTTTDPVKKAMELLPLGPVVLIDTAGLEDDSSLGVMRMEKTREILRQIHVGVVVVDSREGMTTVEKQLMELLEQDQIPVLLVYNKCDLKPEADREQTEEHEIYVSAKTGEHIHELKERLGRLAAVREKEREKRLAGDLLEPGDQVVLVVPIDKAAPKGRLILPQQQTIRDILDAGCLATVCRDTELEQALKGMTDRPKLVITDSQVFGKVAGIVPEDVLMTSFSILFARYKGDLDRLVGGANSLSRLKDKDRVLISEGCTHHRQCGDIGSQKLPDWIREYTGVEPEFSFTSGGEFPADLGSYSLIIHCGGCMLNEKEMQYRLKEAERQGIPITNYGTAIAHMKGILERSLRPFRR